MIVYRVAPVVDGVPSHAPGGPLYVHPNQGGGRWDNPDRYLVLYVARHAEAAVAETFGNLARWGPAMLHHPVLDTTRALIAYDLPDTTRLADLDDPHLLVELSTRPSRVVTRNRATTQALAARIHATAGRGPGGRRWAGIRWWSYWSPEWPTIALWDRDGLTVQRVEPLATQHAAVLAAADHLSAPFSTQGSEPLGRCVCGPDTL